MPNLQSRPLYVLQFVVAVVNHLMKMMRLFYEKHSVYLEALSLSSFYYDFMHITRFKCYYKDA